MDIGFGVWFVLWTGEEGGGIKHVSLNLIYRAGIISPKATLLSVATNHTPLLFGCFICLFNIICSMP